MNNNTNKLDCAIVGDLLPLYHDGAVCDTTKTAVESHLEGCEPCRAELEALRRELPVAVSEKSTGKRFASLMKRNKITRILTIVLPILLACAIVAAGYFAQLAHPFVSFNEQVETPQVFRYETEEGTKFFFLLTRPGYAGALSGEIHTEHGENGAELILDFKRPLLVSTIDDKNVAEIGTYGFNGLDGVAPSCAEVTTVRIGDEIIWTEEQNGDDAVPAYVYEYDRFENGNGEYICQWDVDYDADDPSLCAMTAWYADGRTVVWDLEGNVISEGTEDSCTD